MFQVKLDGKFFNFLFEIDVLLFIRCEIFSVGSYVIVGLGLSCWVLSWGR